MSKKTQIVQATSKGLVLDRSVAIAWCYADEHDAYSQSVLDAIATEPAYVPNLWHLEVTNTLIVGERRKRSTEAETAAWTAYLSELPLLVDEDTRSHAFSAIAHLARAHNLSAYDAAYLELAMRKGLPIATLDEKLRAAARATGVALFGIPR